MKQMKLIFKYLRCKDYKILLDGSPVIPRRDKRCHIVDINTDKDTVELVIYNTLYLRSPFWFLISALMFFVSCFGIFDFAAWRNALFSYCHMIIPLQDGEELHFVPAANRKNGIAFEITGRIPLQILDNTIYEDPIAARRKWILRILRVILMMIALIVAAIIIVISVI